MAHGFEWKTNLVLFTRRTFLQFNLNFFICKSSGQSRNSISTLNKLNTAAARMNVELWNREVDLSTVKQENRNLMNMDKLYSFTHYVFRKKMMIDILRGHSQMTSQQ